jgi:hypothetical protein
MSQSRAASVASAVAMLLLILGIVIIGIGAFSFYLRFPAPGWVNALTLPWIPLRVREIVLPLVGLLCVAGALWLWRRRG